PWWLLAVSFLGCSMLICWNLQSVSHNFIHNPFFTSRWLNRLYGVLESLAIGMPHQLYHHYHMNHHQGDNDAKDPERPPNHPTREPPPPRLVEHLPLQQGHRPRAVLALLPVQLLPRRGRAGPQRRVEARPGQLRSGRGRDAGAGSVLAAHGLVQLALLLVLLP